MQNQEHPSLSAPSYQSVENENGFFILVPPQVALRYSPRLPAFVTPFGAREVPQEQFLKGLLKGTVSIVTHDVKRRSEKATWSFYRTYMYMPCAALSNTQTCFTVSLLVTLIISVLTQPRSAVGQTSLSTTIASVDRFERIDISEGTPHVVPKGPDSGDVLQFEERFTGTINLDVRDIDLNSYDLLTVQVKADRAAVLVFSLDNYPWRGKQARWYVLDGMRGPTGWKTIWIDLRRPEEGPRKRASTSSHMLHITGFHKDVGRSIQGTNRTMLLGEIRAVKKAIDLDWDQRKVTQTWNDGEDLVATYPLTVTNHLDEAVTAEVTLDPLQTRYASAVLSRKRVVLAAHEQKTIRATIRLPADAAKDAQPLYAERFEARAWIPDQPYSTVTILRSSDPIYLTVTVPPPDNVLTFPLLPAPSELPDHIIHFDRSLARRWEAIAPPAELIEEAKLHGISNSEMSTGRRFLKALIAAAYLYDLTREQTYLETASTLLAALPAIWKKFYDEWIQAEVRLISSGIMVRMGSRSHFTLRLGWRLMGTQRSPYQYSYDANARGGNMSAIFYAFDMLAAKLDPSLRERIIREFIVPAGIQCRNHYIGDGNQQATVNAVALYAGLAAHNWPLVSFAYSSEHGLSGIIEWTFTDDGVHIRDQYQTYTLRPIFWLAELLYGRGKNVYDVYRDRLRKAVNRPSFQDTYFWSFAQKHRMSAERPIQAPSGLTARPTSSGTIQLEWTDNATNEAGFIIERSSSPDSEFTRIATMTRYVPRYVDICPSNGSTYYYRVRAYNYHAGESGRSNIAQAICSVR